MFEDFDFNILNDKDFKEDSVREELIVPLIKALGYSVSGDDRIIRSKSLIHPYVAIGSKQRKISIVPDYIFLSDSKAHWILDAKSPTEDIVKSKHVEQAYSYAIHPEVRAEYFSLCNGKEISLYSIKKFDPIMYFKLEDIDKNWESFSRILNPKIQANPDLLDYHLDYGVYLKRLGAVEDFNFIGTSINTNFICKVGDDSYTTNTVIPGDIDCIMSLDFDEELYQSLLGLLPLELAKTLSDGLKRQPYYVLLEDKREFQFGVTAQLTTKFIHNNEETYLPFKVTEFMEYMEF